MKAETSAGLSPTWCVRAHVIVSHGQIVRTRSLLVCHNDALRGQVFLGFNHLLSQLVGGLIGVSKSKQAVPDAKQRVRLRSAAEDTRGDGDVCRLRGKKTSSVAKKKPSRKSETQ